MRTVATLRRRLDHPRARPATWWFCPPCGHVYDPAAGDPSADVAPGTAFERLPHSWRCPVCESLKCDYVPLEPARLTGR